MSRTKLIVSISDNSDFFPSADYAVIELTPESNERIRKLAVVVQQLKAYRISEFNYNAEFMVADYEADPDNGKVALKEFEGRMECTMLNVTDTGFYWSGFYRHTDIRWSSDTVPLAVLREQSEFDQREECPDYGKKEAEGADGEELLQVPQKDGSVSTATGRYLGFEQANIGLASVMDQLDVRGW